MATRPSGKLAPPPLTIGIASPPSDGKFIDNVLTAFANGIPASSYASCALRDKKAPPDGSDAVRQAHLVKFVRERLEDLARLEYLLWINGQLPFISPRELMLWRLQQFARYIWAWQLPDDDDLAMIFNLTKRQAGNLVSDFMARFRKTALFPVAIRRVYDVLQGTPELTGVEVKTQNAIGSVFRVPSRRYIDDTNALISEIRLRRPTRVIRDAIRYERDDQSMWVSDEVLTHISDAGLRSEIFAMYPMPVIG